MNTKILLAIASVLLSFGCSDTPEQTMSADVADSVTVYVANDIITMNPEQPRAEAIAVVGEKILAVGSLDSVTSDLAEGTYEVDSRFEGQVLIPGLIEQHLHPLLAALTLSMEVIAIEDWVVPGGVAQGVTDRRGYLERLAAAEAEMPANDDTLFTWGFHHYFHDKLTRQDLDAISSTRPILVWHRSVHEFILNTPAMEKYGISPDVYATFSPSAREQSNYAEGHFWEQGFYPVLYRVLPDLTAPERLKPGLEFVERYLQSAGVTTIAEPGGLVSEELQAALSTVLGDASTPFRSYFIVDGKTIAMQHTDNLIAATEAPLAWGRGKTA